MLYYDLGKDIIAYTTDRTMGRDGEKIREALGMPHAPFYYPHQTHTDRVLRVDEAFLAKAADRQKELMEGVDAVITDVPGVILGISTADCIPVLVYDPVHHVAAAIHAGWKGTVLRIVEKALDLMQQRYGTQPHQCTSVIGPGISQESFEVGQEVVDKFKTEGFDMDDVTTWMPDRKLTDPTALKPHIDLKEINRRQLIKQGVEEQKITISSVDTYTDLQYFSARREQQGTVKCGRILTGFLLK
ncbi:MAG: peptidoglycan editing factor PgeF [Prevotella sp.]|nr:peptidoglycan editing factor PgeF [Prevotella sp.]